MRSDTSALPVQCITGIGPKRAKLLNRLNITTVNDLLYYLPFRYEDRRNVTKISSLTNGRLETVSGKVVSMNMVRLPKRRLKIFELTVTDGSGLLKAKWFNQPYMQKNFSEGQSLILSGIVKRNSYGRAGFEMEGPEYESAEDNNEDFIHTARIVPVYRTTAGMSVRVLRSLIFNLFKDCLDNIEDPLPEDILLRYDLPCLKDSIYCTHFPPPETDLELMNRGLSRYHKRLSFDELLNLETGIVLLKKKEGRKQGISFNPSGKLLKQLKDNLTFMLTPAQERVFKEILDDMRQPYPMNRLIQGDVGCGKTIVALMAMVSAAECGYQSAIMAPTEILAEQHYINIHRLAEDLGLRVFLLTGSMKERPLSEIESGKADIIVGTHALIQEGVTFHNLGLAVIDEQHRFGVLQRALLRKKAQNPDILVMTATPIPRTLAMTLYGDLDYSVIDGMPLDRSPVVTKRFSPAQKEDIYRSITEEILNGHQVYVVYPVIEESENSDLKSAINGRDAFSRIFPDFRTGLIHGKMKSQEREEIMRAFKDRDIDILVSTTVIEVGVDVPNAAMMLIVHAERFGLPQLHQLRGRVGRGSSRSCCLLLAYEPLSKEARRRLDIMVRTTDGFRIAEEDLDIRGPGEFLGTRQSGMPDLRTANLIRDAGLLDAARKEAFDLVSLDPELAKWPLLKQSISAFWEGKIEIFETV
ncbi:MAG: ATP-dependent DNA helicase RecG [Nitrospirota bacterium]